MEAQLKWQEKQNYLIVSVDSKNGCPDAKFSRAPTTKTLIEFLNRFIKDTDITEQIRTDPGTAFISTKFKDFCEKYFTKHESCPITDYRGSGKAERIIGTITERLRTNKKVVLEKEITGLSEILYALRSAPRKDNFSPAELHFSRKQKTVKDIITTKPNYYTVSELEDEIKLEMCDFPADHYLELLVRKRVRGTKLENLYKRQNGTVTKETPHTIALKESNKIKANVFSNREIAPSRSSNTEKSGKR